LQARRARRACTLRTSICLHGLSPLLFPAVMPCTIYACTDFQLKLNGQSIVISFLADRTATQYDRLLASSCCPSVRLSVCLSVCDAVHSGSQGWCMGLKVVPTCS